VRGTADLSNFGTWTERGAIDADTRATGIWQCIPANAAGPAIDPGRADALHATIRRRSAKGGAPPES